ncbi:MAG TPA: hypothetical protein VG755_36835 [Nannocystaceae bacterium]|nr:hypothetical protein [Nannocystaceae bacterium]
MIARRRLSLAAACLLGCGATASDADTNDVGSGEASATQVDSGGSSGTSPATTRGDTTLATSSEGSSSGSTTDAEPPWRIAFEADESIGALLSTWGPSGAHVYAVGGQQGPGISIGAMLVRARGAWASVALPESTAKLNWIHGNGELRVAVGERGVILVREGDDDATPWATFGCGTVLPLWGVWITASDDVWVVGGDGFDHDPVLCHFDGATWTMLEVPANATDSRGLFKVFGVAKGDVWAVGDGGLLLHYDGVGWSAIDSGTVSDLISLWGTGPTELLAVGGRSSGVLARHTDAWSITMLPETIPGLNGVWMDEGGEATIVGILGTIATVPAGSIDPVFDAPPTMSTLHAVWSPGDGTFIAVGGSLELPPPFTGVIVERP